jgi:PadR family transcriptional regulator, regulatory protein PadR
MGERKTSELVPGTLDMLILKALSRGSAHGYDIAEWIESRSENVLNVEEGALYPALHRLEARGLLLSEWGISANNRRAKFYKLTATGRRHLESESAHWDHVVLAIGRVMKAV